MKMQLKRATGYLALVLSGSLFLTSVSADISYFEAQASYEVYFTPTHNCTFQIIRFIREAKKTLYVQAYFLTSEPILNALIEAKFRGIDIKVILDKKHPENQKGIQKMIEAEIPVWIDYSSGIAHNKVMIIDDVKVLTGSFNFTYSANHRNRENLLLIRDKKLAQSYLENWYSCQLRSKQQMPLKKSKEKTEERPLNELEKLLVAIMRFVRTLIESICDRDSLAGVLN